MIIRRGFRYAGAHGSGHHVQAPLCCFLRWPGKKLLRLSLKGGFLFLLKGNYIKNYMKRYNN